MNSPNYINKLPSLKYSIVVPVFRSEKTLPMLIERLTSQLQQLDESYEIILVEDNGGDKSWQVMENLQKKYENLQIIRLMRNFGQHNALMCGFSFCRGEVVITLDDDLQNPPEEIPKLISTLSKGYDVVYGVPPKRKQHFMRNIGSFLVRAIYKKIFDIQVDLTSFRIMTRDVVRGICEYNKNFTFIDGLLAWHTTNIGEVEVKHDPREIGSTGYSLKKLVTLTVNMLTNFSIGPLQLATFLGLIFSTLGFLIATWFILKYLIFDIPVPGFTSIIVSITLFSGVQMLTLGLIGEYLGRIHLNINSKPQYFIKDCKSSEKE